MRYAIFALQFIAFNVILFAPIYGAHYARDTGATESHSCTVMHILGYKVEQFAEVRCQSKAGTFMAWRRDDSSWETLKKSRHVDCQFKEMSRPHIFGLFGSVKIWVPVLPCKDAPISWPQERDLGIVKKFD